MLPFPNIIIMWYEHNPSIINAEPLEDRKINVVFDHYYLSPLLPSDKIYKRDFTVERKDSFDIAGIDYHSYRYGDLYLLGDKYYDGQWLDLKEEPWNEYDPNAIAIYLLGSKLGYIRREDTDDVSYIMTTCRQYQATLDCSFKGWERINIFSLQEFHDTYTRPYQTDIVLRTRYPHHDYQEIIDFIKGNIGHSVTFWKSNENHLIAIYTDMHSIMGYIDDKFIANQYPKTNLAGFIEDVVYDDKSWLIEVKLRFLMDKSYIKKNYLSSYQALSKHIEQFSDAGTYSIEWSDLLKVVPRKSRTLSAYEPLMKYLKENHAIQLTILNAPKEEDKVRCSNEQAPKMSDSVAVKQIPTSDKQGNTSNANLAKPAKHIKKPSSSVSDFFPLWKITIGKTTWEQAERKGHKVEIWKKGPSRTMSVGVFDFWDNKGEGIFTSAFISRSSYYLPPKWKSKGFSWNRSYDGWLTVFEDLGYKITVKEQPSAKEFNGRKTLSAYFEALAPDGLLLFALRFDFGKDGYLTSSPRTLDFISVTYKGE